ncbi:hypothetical protein [Burkholderia vietnamiensis]|uniref:hypothetical protein n=1 Tax=Burkholderia vietnamiensis TaxID=60552 RepID=UPI0009BEEABE|nr:hypothetical protein [Burkholderia vietnamiensis]
MNNGYIAAIISAVAGITGVILGNLFAAIKEWWGTKTRRDADVAYLAIVVSSHLDRFANGCLSVALDDGTVEGRPAGKNGERTPTTRAPEFLPLEIKVEWKALPREVMHAILRLPDERDQIQNRLGGIIEFNYDPPEHSEYFWARRRDYAKLGLRAGALARQLRALASLEFFEQPPSEPSRDQLLQDMINDVTAKELAYQQRLAQSRPFTP